MKVKRKKEKGRQGRVENRKLSVGKGKEGYQGPLEGRKLSVRKGSYAWLPSQSRRNKGYVR